MVIAIIVGILIVNVILGSAYMISCQRELVDLVEKVQNSLSNIGVQQQSRWDALTQIANMTKSYKEHEANTLINVIRERSSKVPQTAEDVVQAENDFNDVFSRLSVIVESYPELKASNLYQQTIDSINQYEKTVRLARQVYNDCVTKYNRKVKMFPSSLVASKLGYVEEEYIKVQEQYTQMPNLEI